MAVYHVNYSNRLQYLFMYARILHQAVELATPEEKAKQTRLGGVVAQFKGAGYSLTDAGGRRVKLLDDFTYEFRQRDRIGIVGPNGVGNSDSHCYVIATNFYCCL